MLSAPVEAPWVKVTVLMVLLVKLKSEGNVMMIVWPAVPAPLGVVNLITWLERALKVWFDIVSERALKDAASATRVGPNIKRRLLANKEILAKFERYLCFMFIFNIKILKSSCYNLDDIMVRILIIVIRLSPVIILEICSYHISQSSGI